MNRKTSLIIIKVLILSILSIIIYTEITSVDPLKEQFNGIITSCSRMYPSKIKFKLENQSKSYYMANELEKFLKSISIGDSISKVKDDPYVNIYKKVNDKYEFFIGFTYE